MEDSGLEQMTEELEGNDSDFSSSSEDGSAENGPGRNIDDGPSPHLKQVYASDMEKFTEGGVVRTLDGEVAGDEFAQDAMNYQILLGKIDSLLEGLKLDA